MHWHQWPTGIRLSPLHQNHKGVGQTGEDNEKNVRRRERQENIGPVLPVTEKRELLY